MIVEPQPALDSKGRAARAIVLPCAVLSLGLMFWVGRHNKSMLLVLMFTVWVGSPFAGLIWLQRVAMHWGVHRQLAAFTQVNLISLASLATYAAVTFLIDLAKPAAPFLVVPALTWVLVAVVVWTGNFKEKSPK